MPQVNNGTLVETYRTAAPLIQPDEARPEMRATPQLNEQHLGPDLIGPPRHSSSPTRHTPRCGQPPS